MDNTLKTIISLKKNETNYINQNIFGQFIEHLGNCIDNGLFEPNSPLSNAEGFRNDVIEKVKRLSPPCLRWPGGTFANIYHWMDCIGPIEQRKKRPNIIWGGINDGKFGTDEFIKYCHEINSEPMICVNMETGTAEEAANWVEYCNGTEDTYYANLRKSNGSKEPHNVKYWFIGNESYAIADIGSHHNVDDYIKDTWEFVKHMKLVDSSIKIILVGSMYDFEWNKRVLDSLHPVCDYLSIHYYARDTEDNPYGAFSGEEDFVGSIHKLKSFLQEYKMPDDFNEWYRFPPRQKAILLALDEWNIWNSACDEGGEYGLNARYNWLNALWVSSMLNIFINSSDVLGCANMAQMVNILAPIITDRESSVCQTIFYPLEIYRKYCKEKKCGLSYGNFMIDGGEAGEFPLLSISATMDKSGKYVTVFIINRSLDEKVLGEFNGNESITSLHQYGAKDALEYPDLINPFEVIYKSKQNPEDGEIIFPPNTITVVEIESEKF